MLDSEFKRSVRRVAGVLGLVLALAVAFQGNMLQGKGSVQLWSVAHAQETAAEAPAGQAPLTLKALRYMPENAQLAIGIPPASSIMERLVPFVQLFLQDIDLVKEIELVASDLALEMEVPADGGIVGVLAAMGFDSGAGMAAFLDMAELAEVVAAAAAADSLDEMPDLAALNGVLVIPVNDPVKAEASLMKLLGDLLSGMERKEEQVGEVTVKAYEGFGGYFVNNAVMALGNDMNLLVGAARRTGAPASFQYGSDTCPPDDIHEAVALAYGDRLIPLMELFAGQVAKLETTAQILLNVQMERMRQIYKDVPLEEPIIITCSVGEEYVELKSKVDTEKYPSLLEFMGQAGPLQWASRLPVDTKAFLSLNVTDRTKKQLTDVYLESVPEDMRTRPGISQTVMHSMNALELFGGEITFGVGGLETMSFPSAFLMIQLAENEGARILLRIAPQADYQEPYREVQIKTLQVPFLVPIYFAEVENTLVMSNNDAGIRAIIDLAKDGKTSGFFESLDPPIPADRPIYQALVIKPSLYTDVVAPMTSITGQDLPDDAEAVMTKIAELFEDVRLFNEMQGRWSVGRIYARRK